MTSNSNNGDVEKIPKKRGRKPKLQKLEQSTNEKIPKKRGRKPKNITEEQKKTLDTERKRKRGRKPKCDIASIDDIRQKFMDSDDKVVFSNNSEYIEPNLDQIYVPFGNLNIIVHQAKPYDKEKLRNMFTDGSDQKDEQQTKIYTINDGDQYKILEPTKDVESDIESEIEPEIEETIKNESTISNKKTDTIINKSFVASNKPENKNIIVKERKRIFKLLHKFTDKIEETKEWPTSTNILCWWCCHNFNTIPIPCTSKYDDRKRRYSFYGIFCSWECSAAYCRDNHKSMFDFYKLRQEWTGLTSRIKPAPSRYILKSFGGYMSIGDFRNTSYIERNVILMTNDRCSYENQEVAEIIKELAYKKKYKV